MITQPDPLLCAVGALLGTPAARIDYQSTPLHGGTLGDVQLLSGEAETPDGKRLPFRLVQKTQKRWQRPGDPASWRREYDLFPSALSAAFTPSFRAPRMLHAETYESENRIWMETIEGRSGARLSPDDLARAALELGRFQGRCHRQESALRNVSCLGDSGVPRREYAQWTPGTVEYRWLRSADCTLPDSLQTLLIDTQAQADAIFLRLGRLPQVLCHRDYWTENIFAADGGIVAIDWDCAGWGCVGEDIASLIADETEPQRIAPYFRLLMPAYYKGLREYISLPPMDELPIREMILLKFGYRLAQQVQFGPRPEQKAEAIAALRQIGALR
jgi:hypothetical protein